MEPSIIEALRDWPATGRGDGLDAAVVRRLMRKAADEIERLQRALGDMVSAKINQPAQ